MSEDGIFCFINSCSLFLQVFKEWLKDRLPGICRRNSCIAWVTGLAQEISKYWVRAHWHPPKIALNHFMRWPFSSSSNVCIPVEKKNLWLVLINLKYTYLIFIPDHSIFFLFLKIVIFLFVAFFMQLISSCNFRFVFLYIWDDL